MKVVTANLVVDLPVDSGYNECIRRQQVNDELHKRFYELFQGAIEGGVTKDMYEILDEAIENEEFTDEEVQENEMAIATLFDDGWFTCVVCGWTMPIDQMGEDRDGEFQCQECEVDAD